MKLKLEIGNRSVSSSALVVDQLTYPLIIGHATLQELGFRLTGEDAIPICSVSVRNVPLIYSLEDVEKYFPTVLKPMDASWSPTVHVAFQLKDDAKVIARKLSREK